ncbi:MAG: hypothetical protein Q9227_006090 [Pyrenula ochraceoflavens]
MASAQYHVETPPGDAISSIQFSPRPGSKKLVVSSWDRSVYVYAAGPPGQNSCTLISRVEHNAPVLDACFGKDDNEIFTAGLDWDIYKVDVSSNSKDVLSTHEAGARCVTYSQEHDLVISGSWDSTLHVHRPSDVSFNPATIPLPSKVFALSLSPTKLIVAMASRAIYIYDLKSLALLCAQSETPPPNRIEVEPFQRRESSLKFMTRATACMPDDSGYATSSIEGRVAVEWFDSSAESQARKYAFKCHRQNVDDVDVVYPVNALAFHPKHGTFASGGGDGLVALWDAHAKRRIRQYQKFSSSVAALSFSADGDQLAIAISPGFEDGKEDIMDGAVKIFIRELGPNETKGKGTK